MHHSVLSLKHSVTCYPCCIQGHSSFISNKASSACVKLRYMLTTTTQALNAKGTCVDCCQPDSTECTHRSSPEVVKVCSQPYELILADLQLHCCSSLRLSICGFCGCILHGNLIHQVPKEAVLHDAHKLQQKRAMAKVPCRKKVWSRSAHCDTIWHSKCKGRQASITKLVSIACQG